MVVGPAHTPAPIVAKFHDAFGTVENVPDIRQHIVQLGMVPKASPPADQLQAFIDSEMVRWGKVVKQAGLAGTE
jgi:tripartite-type tricarboxylate transporter receptor subunit TctC